LDPEIAIAAFAVGLVFGSFLNVCIHRLPQHLSVVHPGSACPHCHHPIRVYDNVPVVSWFVLRGRCRDCGARISHRYVIVELLTGCLFLACYAHFGFTLTALKFCVFGFLLLGLIFTDAETHLLPDRMTLPGIALGLVFAWLVPVGDLLSQFLPMLVPVPMSMKLSGPLLSFLDSLLGALVGASFIYGAGALYLRARGVEGMGFGDVKLIAMIGAFLGFRLTLLTVFAASIVGSIVGLSTVIAVWLKRTRRRMDRQKEIASVARRRAWASAHIALRRYQMPFGVFLGTMAILAFFFGNQFLHWYWRLR
jgi:leader peptidase (prepilin peptidase)/N-methyltransferase